MSNSIVRPFVYPTEKKVSEVSEVRERFKEPDCDNANNADLVNYPLANKSEAKATD